MKLADFALKSLRRRTIATRGVLCGVPVISRHKKRCPGGVVVQKSTQMAVLQCEWAVARAFGRRTGSKQRSVGGGRAPDTPPHPARSIDRWMWARSSRRTVVWSRSAQCTAVVPMWPTQPGGAGQGRRHVSRRSGRRGRGRWWRRLGGRCQRRHRDGGGDPCHRAARGRAGSARRAAISLTAAMRDDPRASSRAASDLSAPAAHRDST